MEDVLRYKEYQAVVQYSTKDEVFFGTIGGITDLVTFEGGVRKHYNLPLKKRWMII